MDWRAAFKVVARQNLRYLFCRFHDADVRFGIYKFGDRTGFTESATSVPIA
jgi:hypothetical protein